DVQYGVEIVFRYIPEVSTLLETSIVHKDVDLAESGDGLVNKSLPFGNLSDVRLKRYRALLGCLGDTGSHFVRTRFVLAIANRDIGAFTGQAFRDRAPDSLIAACYRGHFSVQSIWQHSSSRILFLVERNPIRPFVSTTQVKCQTQDRAACAPLACGA